MCRIRPPREEEERRRTDSRIIVVVTNYGALLLVLVGKCSPFRSCAPRARRCCPPHTLRHLPTTPHRHHQKLRRSSPPSQCLRLSHREVVHVVEEEHRHVHVHGEPELLELDGLVRDAVLLERLPHVHGDELERAVHLELRPPVVAAEEGMQECRRE